MKSSLPTTISDLLGTMFDDDGEMETLVIEQATQSLLAAFEKHLIEILPEKKKFSYSDIYGNDSRNNYGYGEERFRDGSTYGYAKAIDHITQLIKENREGL